MVDDLEPIAPQPQIAWVAYPLPSMISVAFELVFSTKPEF